MPIQHQQDVSLILTSMILTVLFLGLTPHNITQHNKASLEGQVVISAPVQLLMYGGDRFLAADLETIRAATLLSDSQSASTYRLRAHNIVSLLNPCHEDNYYMANAILTWGGQEQLGNEVVGRAMACRSWDELPAFFYGFNNYFFFRNTSKAIEALNIAASRSADNAPALRKLAIMITAEEFNDEQLALQYLHDQRDNAKDKVLKEMLDKRVARIQGLIILRDAQREFVKRYSRPLQSPNELITSGIIEQFPNDPMKLGYEFLDGQFRLRSMKIIGLESHS